MTRAKLFTSTITILAASTAAGLMVWKEAAQPRPAAAVVPAPAPVVAVSPTPRPTAADAALPTAAPAPLLPASAASATPGLRPDLPRDMAMPTPLGSPGAALRERMAAVTSGSAPAAGEATVARNAFGVPCGIALSGRAMAPALVSLTLTAPCRPDTAVTVRHGELVFTGRTNSLGTLTLRVPALSDPAAVEMRFADGAGESIELPVPDLAEFTRVGLQWQGDAGLQLHALEFGADYGEPGHVWTGAPRGPEFAASRRGGFVARLGEGGNDAHFAEIYTYPAGARTEDGVVRLSIEAEVTEANCGREIAGHSLQPDLDGRIVAVELSLAMPGCDAVGEFLVLKNILRDLRIAAR